MSTSARWFRRGGALAAYRYERWVSGSGDDRTSTHVTLGLDGTPVLLHRARHDSGYRLRRFESVHTQTGIRSTIEVRDDGRVDFTVHRGAKVRRHHEGPGDPIVVGPTLFGFIRSHWATLARGDTIPVRFGTTGRTYGFELHLAERRVDRAVVTMVASGVFVRLGIDPIRIELDLESDQVVRYHGRVPVLLDGDAFDADIEYAYERSFR
ncbi:hypothetical protein [Enhygromyxa salina]|uniref:DUF3108 domain-containing protein n=1 Tax=Enhygromyxa salina TaxID=215803 RepID=A0A2S9YWB7_9BACT|nr:hypothetical protein [Enhygromyxa salina]PRQ09342.1 hypothetical protein ENSA7_09310 [Enhygromyxa salina]